MIDTDACRDERCQGRIAAVERKTKRPPTDLTEKEWGRRSTAAEAGEAGVRAPQVDLPEVPNAIRYMTRSGGGWCMLAKDFPSCQTVHWWHRSFLRLVLFRTIHDIALMMDWERIGREMSPSAGAVDSEMVSPGCRARRAAEPCRPTGTKGEAISLRAWNPGLSPRRSRHGLKRPVFPAPRCGDHRADREEKRAPHGPGTQYLMREDTEQLDPHRPNQKALFEAPVLCTGSLTREPVPVPRRKGYTVSRNIAAASQRGRQAHKREFPPAHSEIMESMPIEFAP